MSQIKFETLIPRINTSVPGCPQPLMLSALRDSARRVCERTLLWRVAVDPFILSPGVHEYFYRKPLNADVHAVFDAAVNGLPLDRATLEQALMRYPKWADLYSGVPLEELWGAEGAFGGVTFNEQTFNGGAVFNMPPEALVEASSPMVFTQLTPDKFVVLPAPDADREYRLRLIVALKPKRDAEGLPDHIFAELEDCIFHGALQDLLVLPNEAWGDRDLAAYHARQFLFHVTERRARANLGNARATVSARMQPFA